MAFTGQLTGNLGRDPKVKYFDNGSQVADFSLAVRQWKQDAPARWVKVSAWGKTAEFVANYLKKGDKVVAFGRVDAPEMYEKKTGGTALIERFNAAEIEFAESKAKSQDNCDDGFCPMPSQTQPVATQQAAKTEIFPPVGSDEVPF